MNSTRSTTVLGKPRAPAKKLGLRLWCEPGRSICLPILLTVPPLLALWAAVISYKRHERDIALAQEAAVAASDTVLRTLSHRVLNESGLVVASALNEVLKELHGHERIIFALAGAGTMLIMLLVGRLLLSQRRQRASTKALAASAQQLQAEPAQRQNSQRRGLGALARARWCDDRSGQICARTRGHRIGR